MENNMNHCMLWLAGMLVLGGLIGGFAGYKMGYSAGQANHASDLAAGTKENLVVFLKNLKDVATNEKNIALAALITVPSIPA